ncbi:hypothetical protein [Azospirillum picis]|uniref:Uncharacterized protein n=1 Tax=Azospirillum picis TaxID=488438 RepID=A0ABU0MPR8_9PROT|nr:hypothetical protein [Azospirillum picis]MBP2301569.1 hypothetical protein [Azospirillum picis]MDQ0535401.1 hypothetical protein [Azospirillum picis]
MADPKKTDAALALVKVQCIVHTQPWANGKPLGFKEIVEVTPEDAAILEANEQVLRLG